MERHLLRNLILIAAIAGSSLVLASCGSKLAGTYSDANGSFILELRSGGQATFTFMGDTAQCTYTADGNQLTLDCKGAVGKTVFTIHDDGSLTGPPGTFMPALRKRKS